MKFTGENISYDFSASFRHIIKLCKNEQLDDAIQFVNLMCHHGIQLPSNILHSLLQACIDKQDLAAGREAHSLVIRNGFEKNSFLGSFLVRMFALSRSLFEANLVFSKLSEPNVFTWSAIISAHADNGDAWEAIELYHKMQDTSMKPDAHTFVAALKACATAAALIDGKLIHANLVESGFESNTFIGNTLIDLYAKCGNLESARNMFDKLPKQGVVTWNAMITGYAHHGHAQEAVQLFHEMQHAGVLPNNVTCNAIIVAHAQHRHSEEALEIFHLMREEGRQPDIATFVNLLKACSSAASLGKGKVIHAFILENGFQSNAFVGSALIDMYVKGNSLKDARIVFDSLPMQDVVTWSAMIAGYAQHGQCEEARQLLQRMEEGGIEPNNVAYNAIIAGYTQHGQGIEAVQYFQEMQEEGKRPSSVVLVSILKVCSGSIMLDEGKLVHSHIVESSLECDEWVGSFLINMYVRCGSLQDAQTIFDKFPQQCAIISNAMITCYAQNGHGQEALQLYWQLQLEGCSPEINTFISTLDACSSLAALMDGKVIHTQIMESGFRSDFVSNTLINMYLKCGSLKDAHGVFSDVQKGDTGLWNTMISGYAHHGHHREALIFFQQMQQDGVEPDGVTFYNVLKSCGSTGSLAQGRLIHGLIIENGLDSDEFVGTALIDIYAKCGCLDSARLVFDRLQKRDVVTWSVMIEGYVQHECSSAAFNIFQQMLEDGSRPDCVLYISILKACTNVAFQDQGKMVHAYIIQQAFDYDVCVGNSLIDMYAKCGSLKDAHTVFDRLPQKDAVSWNSMITAYAQRGDFQKACEIIQTMCQNRVEPNNATWNTMITGYVQHGYNQEALNIYNEMQQNGRKPDNITFVSILKACSSIAVLNHGKQIHAYIAANGSQSDFLVSNTLINMYVKGGSLEDALLVFHKAPKQDVVTWNAIIGGYALHNDYKLTLQYFEEMQLQGLEPDDVTFMCVLSACSHSGLVSEGSYHFKSISEKYNMKLKLEHLNAMVHLLGYAGHLDEAEALLEATPFLCNIVGWTSLLSSCRSYGNVDLGRRCFDQVVTIDHKFASGYVLMADIYSSAGI